MSPSSTPNPFPVTVHPFTSATPGSCAYERGSSSSARKNALVFVPGLTSGPHATDLDFLATMLKQSPSLDYSLWEFRMRSSYSGFGYSSLVNDVQDMAALVQYLRGIGKERIVLMGSSTGCQDCLEYADRTKYPQTPPVDGYILTSPVSDRESAFLFMSPDELGRSVRVAADLIDNGCKGDAMPQECLPFFFTTPVTAYRWHSLAAKGGDEDYFSSDLDDSTLAAAFGRVDKLLLILSAGDDELVPPTVDREALLGRWIAACRPGIASDLSGFIPGANHVVSKPEAQAWLAERVGEFLGRVSQVGGV
ncbi:DUF1749-domain-containing protein [Parathielavia hyrcaniae]|uniref:DUF1749-domain-containing protein n=1 Tax=Parathielavia hyrcaniae TaxID=113614 RepID=A0AAN6PU15_9PEZI|nr:DUF1749-domain-containing protein [Parathielavia hyrcaniae]